MPLKTLLSKTGPSPALQPRSPVLDEGPASPDGASSPWGRHRGQSLKRLSLGLSRTNEDPSRPFLSFEPDDTHPPSPSGRDLPDAADEAVGGGRGLEHATARGPGWPSQTVEPAPDTHRNTSGPAEEDSVPPLKARRFSKLGFRHASDPQLSTRFKKESETAATDAAPPTIITTAPTRDFEKASRPKPKRTLFARASSPFRKSSMPDAPGARDARNVSDAPSEHDELSPRTNRSATNSSFERLPRPKTAGGVATVPPPAYGDETSSALAIPVARLSDSSRSDDSSGEHHVYAKTTTTHTISTTTTFFKLKMRRKDKGPLFPLPERLVTPASGRTSTSFTPHDSADERKSMSPSRRSTTGVRFGADPLAKPSGEPSPTHSAVALTNAPFGSPGSTMVRQESAWSMHSGQSTPSVSLAPPKMPGGRGRSSTLSSLGKAAEKALDSAPPSGSARTSTSTNGRRSFGDLLSLPHRLRQNSAPPSRYGAASTPGTPGSKSNSLQISREVEPEKAYPPREDGDTPASYLAKLEAAVPRSAMATILCKDSDEFSKTCLRKYMRGLSYFGDAVDMAVRKMLMEVELPKETQQIDRLLAGFADRYYECNPGVFSSVDETAFVAFSILLLHSDTHNKNNKRKMQKHDYIKNTRQGPVMVSSDILDCFYDNICYTPFIHFEDEVAITTHRLAAPKPRKSLMRPKSVESLRGPVDPYTLILDHKLDALRPSLKDVMDTEDSYSAVDPHKTFDTTHVHQAFAHSAVMQIVSARSRPDAFMSQATISNPGEAQAGIVSIQVAKVGLLWRKDVKKKKAKRPWQEWGAILTDSKLYFFKDVGWVKKLISQYDAHARATPKAGPLVFRPPLSSFEPDALMSMDDAVALVDASYKKHKHAFNFIKHGGFEEIFLANHESDMLDWIGKLNYAAAFRTAGVRMRGLVAPTYDGRRVGGANSADASSNAGDPPQHDQRVDAQMAWEIMFYRRQLIHEKLSDFDEKIAAAQKELDQLLRNARHMLILTPIQPKTRELLVLAAGRMSAKLKWTRIELWRNKTHRDILAKDLEQESPAAFPVPQSPPSSLSQKAAPRKHPPITLDRTNTDTSNATMSPISATSSRPSNLAERLRTAEKDGPRPAVGSPDPASSAAPVASDDKTVSRVDPTPGHYLAHQASTVSSSHSREKDRGAARPAEDGEEHMLRDAGLLGTDGTASRDKRPDASESDRDRVGAISPMAEVSKNSSVRRSLHRSLREGHFPHGHHHSPSVHRHKKARDSGSSMAATEDGSRSVQGDADELRRGAGSFILHGKKASVITMSSEWQTMSNEERLRLRKAGAGGDEKEPASATRYRDANANAGVDVDVDADVVVDVEADADALETESHASQQSDAEHFGSVHSSRKHSLATDGGECFVDAETGDDHQPSSPTTAAP